MHADNDGGPLKLNGLGRIADMERSDRVLAAYFNRPPTDDELRVIHELLRDTTNIVWQRSVVTFPVALVQLKTGKRVRRQDWHRAPGNNWLVLIHDNGWRVEKELAGNTVGIEPFIAVCSHDELLAPWCPTHADLLAEDWEMVS